MTPQHDKAKRWRQVSIRDLLFCTLIVGLCIGWWQDRQRFEDEVELLRGYVGKLEVENELVAKIRAVQRRHYDSVYRLQQEPPQTEVIEQLIRDYDESLESPSATE